MVDHSIDYSIAAGKGTRDRQRRERLTLAEIPKKLNIKKAKPYERKPEFEQRRKKRENMSEAYHAAIGLKTRIRLLVIDRDASYLELMELLKQQGWPVSGVTAGNLRSEMREIMKLLESLDLLNVEALQRRRKKIKAGETV